MAVIRRKQQATVFESALTAYLSRPGSDPVDVQFTEPTVALAYPFFPLQPANPTIEPAVDIDQTRPDQTQATAPMCSLALSLPVFPQMCNIKELCWVGVSHAMNKNENCFLSSKVATM